MATKRKFVVSGDQRLGIADKCWEIMRQLKLANGSPLDPTLVDRALQDIIEGRFLTTQSDQPAPQPKPVEALLERITVVSVSGSEAFAGKDHFKEGGKAPGGINLWLGDNFKRHLAAKIEIDIPAKELRVHRLLKRSVDAPIIAELGGEGIAETSLAYLWELIARQPKGEDGVLLTNRWANIFYIRAADGVLWAVRCRWLSGSRDWGVGAYPFTRPFGWRDGDQVVSC